MSDSPPASASLAGSGTAIAYWCRGCPLTFTDADSANAHHDATGHWQTHRDPAAAPREERAAPSAETSLGQEWVSRVTQADAPESPDVIGAAPAGAGPEPSGGQLYSADVSRIVAAYVDAIVARASGSPNYDADAHAKALADFDGMLHGVWVALGCPSDETGLVGGAEVISGALEGYEADRQEAGRTIADLRTRLAASEASAARLQRERDNYANNSPYSDEATKRDAVAFAVRAGISADDPRSAYTRLWGRNLPPTLTMDEALAAVLVALTHEGVRAWNGDATSIVAQIILNLHQQWASLRAPSVERERDGEAFVLTDEQHERLASLAYDFACPSCGSSHFGSDLDPATGAITRRHCHDEFGERCRWSGSDDAECFPFEFITAFLAARARQAAL